MPKFTFIAVVLFLFGSSVLSVLKPWQNQSPTQAFLAQSSSNQPLILCEGIYVYDGDTFACDFNGNHKVDGQDEHLRLLGIDATEMHYSPKNHTGKDEPFALEAKNYVSQAIMHKTLYLELDKQRYDRYNRTLAYVYLDKDRKTMLNRVLLQQGLARLLFLGINRRYESDFKGLEATAEANHLKLWSNPQS